MSSAEMTTGEQTRALPHDLDAEEALLGILLISDAAVAVALEICSPADFYKPSHAHIFAAAVAAVGRGRPVDVLTVADELRRRGLLDTDVDRSQLIELQANTAPPGHARHYAEIVAELARRRDIIILANELIEAAHSSSGERIRAIVAQLTQVVAALVAIARPHTGEGGIT